MRAVVLFLPLARVYREKGQEHMVTVYLGVQVGYKMDLGGGIREKR